ncbi:MAG: DUF4445 domain-containing protein [SAR202 cluster bacterium]|nr:DUF4445 domain-containing protein [SAR202 cluster bacterium]
MSPLKHGDRELKLVAGKTIFDFADDLHLRVPTSCGRNGDCHECIVEVRQGMDALSSPTPEESFLRGNYRLACQAAVVDPEALVEFNVLRRQPKILTASVKRDFKLDPLTVRRGDDVVWLGGEGGRGGPVRLDEYSGAIYGIALDLGTTTVAMHLVDLETGRIAYTASFENPQRFGGSDIMNRISYDGGKYRGELKQVAHSSVNFEIGDMVRRLKIRRRQIYEMVVVGNSTMRDIFFGLDVQSIGEKPYRSLTEHELLAGKRSTTALNVKAGELGMRIHPSANVYAGPLIGSHVGADIAADLLAIAMDEEEDPVILVDVGTNTEVVVGNRHRMLAASCPAGPAFEGGAITYGMPGYDGAVETLKLAAEGVEFKTIGNKAPQGICGSGLIDLLAELRRVGRMNELGVLTGGDREFEFVPDKGLTISRADISALAQAKSANFCGQQIVLRRYGLPIEKFKRLYLAGGFANYVDVDNALAIGFVANVPRARITKIGNASLEGASVMLLSGELRSRVEGLVRTIEHVELETEPDFFELFVEGCHFRPMFDAARG